MKTSVEFEVKSAAGELLYTSPHRDLALREARRLMPNNPGVYVEAQVSTRKRIWTDRSPSRPAQAPTYHNQQGAMQ